MTDQANTYDVAAPLDPVVAGNPVATRAERALSGLRFRPFLTVLAIVTVLAGAYYAFIAAPLYVSETQFAIRSASGAKPPSGLIAGLGGGGASLGGLSEITSVSEFIRSPDMLKILDARHDLRRKYAEARLDPFRRMSADVSDEAFLKFYRRMITVQLDREADIILVRVRSFDPDTAHDVARSVLGQSESFIDGLSSRLRRETMASAEAELELAQRQVQGARAAVASFRSLSDDVDPEATGAQAVGGVSALEAQAGSIRAELNALRTYARPTAPQVRQAEARLASVNAQLATLRASQGSSGQVAGSTGGLSQRVSQYEALIAQRDFAEQKRGLAQTSYDSARTSAQQREKYVVQIVQPNRPQQSTEPRRVADFLMVLLFAGAGYAIITMTIAAVRDHQGV